MRSQVFRMVKRYLSGRSAVNNDRLYKHNMFDCAMFSIQFLCRGSKVISHECVWWKQCRFSVCRMAVSFVFTLICLYCFWFVSAHWCPVPHAFQFISIAEMLAHNIRMNNNQSIQEPERVHRRWVVARAVSVIILFNIILCTTDCCRVENDLWIFFSKTLSQAF